jgi:hypothetical protein
VGGVKGELTAFAENVEKLNSGVDDPALNLTAVSLQKSLVAPVRPALMILFFAVALLLLIACANVANLLLARTASRSKEIAVRLALGASRARLAMLLLTESAFVSLLAGAVGVFIAEAGLNFIRAQSSKDLPRFSEINLDWHVFAFAFGVSIFSGVFFGLAPALAGAKLNLNAPLKEGTWESTSGSRWLSNGTFTALQFGLATILLSGACGNSGLEGSSFRSRNFAFHFGDNRGNRNIDGARAGAGDFPRGSPRSIAAIVARFERTLARPDSRLPRFFTGLPRFRPHGCLRSSAEELRTRVEG